MVKLAIIGHLAGDEELYDGQTVKTRSLWTALHTHCAKSFQLIPVDTWYIKRNPVHFARDLWSGLAQCDAAIVIPSKRGRRVLFPILYYVKKFRRIRVFHDAIGGRLVDELKQSPRYAKYVASFDGNWMESRLQVRQLHEMGIASAVYVPNFKRFQPLPPRQETTPDAPLRCCTFSRVMREKGISDAIDAVAALNKQRGAVAVTLDVYGGVTEDYQKEFNEKCAQNAEFVQYMGVEKPENSVKVLRNYDLLLFPSRFRREGIPGTVIDALAAGIPVLAREWKYGREMIDHGKTGFLYDYDHPERLTEWLAYCADHRKELLGMEEACLEAGSTYSEERVLPMIAALLQKGI